MIKYQKKPNELLIIRTKDNFLTFSLLLWELNITHIIVCSTRMLKVKLKILLIANNFALSKIYLHTLSKDLLL